MGRLFAPIKDLEEQPQEMQRAEKRSLLGLAPPTLGTPFLAWSLQIKIVFRINEHKDKKRSEHPVSFLAVLGVGQSMDPKQAKLIMWPTARPT